MGKKQITALLVCLSLAVLLPVIGHFIRRTGEPGCAYDGQPIDPAYKVTIRDPQRRHEFCCVRCAELFLSGKGRPGRQATEALEIRVTDESSGEEIPASAAFFVRSQVVTMKTTLNRVHVFKDKSAAEYHALRFHGTVLAGEERPFSKQPDPSHGKE